MFGSDVYESIYFKIGMSTGITELYGVIPLCMNLNFIGGHRRTRKWKVRFLHRFLDQSGLNVVSSWCVRVRWNSYQLSCLCAGRCHHRPTKSSSLNSLNRLWRASNRTNSRYSHFATGGGSGSGGSGDGDGDGGGGGGGGCGGKQTVEDIKQSKLKVQTFCHWWWQW